MSEKIILFSYLNLHDVGATLITKTEPGNDDITFLVEAGRKMPKTPDEIEDFDAPYLASISLQAMQRCNELRARAMVYAGFQKVDLDAHYGSLIYSSDKAATITKEISKSKTSYVSLAKEHEKAKAYVEFYSGMMGQFEKCHYWAKSREASNQQEFKSSGYEAVTDRKQYRTEFAHSGSNDEQKSVSAVEDVNL